MENETLETHEEPKQPQKSKMTLKKMNLILIILVIGALALFAWAEQQRKDALQKLEEISRQLDEVKGASQQANAEAAVKVLERVKAHIFIPEEPKPTVATITDIESLRETNTFYENAQNGDHLIISAKRAILYDPDSDIILDVLPVHIERRDDSTADQAKQPNPKETSAANESASQ